MRSVLLVSLVLNVALAAALITWLVSAPPVKSVAAPASNAAVVISNRYAIVKTNFLIRPRTFTWQEVESPDYATYVQNLRELGMPETTIRDIIVADIDQLFAKRKRQEDAKQDIEWWRSTPSYEAQSNALARANIMENERDALLTKLLGEGWDKGRSEQQRTSLALTGPVLGNLPDEVKSSVQDIAARSRDRLSASMAEAQGRGQPPNPAELARIREETRQQLAAILNPQQLEEFLLRYSENATQLRRELTGFNATPDEFRAIFRVIEPIDREIGLRYAGDDPASQRARQNLEQQRLAVIRNVVGTERFAAYETAQDPAFHEALTLAQQAGGNDETALALYEIQKATADELNRIRNDPGLSEAQKQQQIREATADQQKARALVLGESPPAEPVANAAPPQPQLRAHVLEPFETLGQLSLRYGVRISELRAANPGIDINRARPGTVLNIPTPGPAPGLPLPPGLPARP